MSERYRLERALGAGGMGAVHLAYDRELDRTVALKRGHGASPDELLRFKREFRAIEPLVHPHLVRLFELGHDDEGLYFTMEAIDGEPLAAWCAAGDRVERAEKALPQIASALAFLHAHGVVHCDLKPSNVMVDREGGAKVLDFGVLAELSRAERGLIGGTPAYLAPERAAGAPATPSTDAYALGCTLFEIVTGGPLFEGPRAAVMAQHAESPAPRLRSRVPEASAALDALCAALLAKRPEERAPVSAALRTSPSSDLPRVATGLIGRDALLETLRGLLATRDARLVVLRGPSGVGKSRLLDWIAHESREVGHVVLRGASRANERLAFNALDAAMDDLAGALQRARARTHDARTLRVAAEAFPVLRPHDSLALDQARESVRMRLFGWRERLERESREEVFAAVARLLDGVAREHGGVLIADDFQWADDDSVALARHLHRATAATWTIVLALRDDVPMTGAHSWLAAEPGARSVDVPSLTENDTRTLVRRTLEALGTRADEAVIAEAARNAEGRPFLAEAAARALARGSLALDEVVAQAVASDAELLTLLVATDGWTRISTTAQILARPLGEIDDRLVGLEREGIVRRVGDALEGRVDFYHDRVRALCAARVERASRSMHGRIADHLLRHDPSTPQRAVRHLVAADRLAEAAQHARRAADAAARQRAFGLAADMYEVALTHEPGDRGTRQARAWALENISRYREAASEWSRLARDAPPAEREALQVHEAHALIAANRTAEGIARLGAALKEGGHGSIRVSGLRAVETVIRFGIGPLRGRIAPSMDDALRGRAQRHLKIGLLLAYLDPLTGIRFLQRARSEFLEAGAAAEVAGCDWVFAIMALAGSRDVEHVGLAERYARAATERAEGLDLPPDVSGLRPFVEGLRAMRRADWPTGHRHFEEAAEIFRLSAGTTELTMSRSWQMMMSSHAQDLPEMRRMVAWFDRHAASCGGTFLVAHLALCQGYARLLEGGFDEAFDTLTRAADAFDDEPPNAQRAALLVYRWACKLYTADPVAVHREVQAAFHAARSFRFLSTMYAQPYGIVAALSEANALRVGDKSASARRVERVARRMDASPPLAAGVSWRARAYVADTRGRPDLAIAYLERAEREAARFDRKIDVEVARYQRGLRLGGDEGRALVDGSRAAVGALGASELVLREDAGRR